MLKNTFVWEYYHEKRKLKKEINEKRNSVKNDNVCVGYYSANHSPSGSLDCDCGEGGGSRDCDCAESGVGSSPSSYSTALLWLVEGKVIRYRDALGVADRVAFPRFPEWISVWLCRPG